MTRLPMRGGAAFCQARLPKAGLGNKLFVWARAFVFARLNQLPLVVSGWLDLQRAPLLRGGDLRLYWNYFQRVRQVGLVRRCLARRSAAVVREPPLTIVDPPRAPTVFEFSQVPHWAQHFQDIKPYRAEVREGLCRMLTPARRHEIAAAPKAPMCLHVRRGDFRPLAASEEFTKVGGVRTPLDYFQSNIQLIRQLHGSELPVTVVSDGSRTELRELLAVPGVALGPRQTAIADLLMMAASKVLVTSAGSTFGYWAGFLGDCALILHPDHIHQSIRPAEVNEKFYEGPATGPPRPGRNCCGGTSAPSSFMLCVIETHPVQYHAPVYRAVQQQFGIPVTALYGSDFSVAGYTDREFGARFAWDVDLLAGHAHRFLATVQSGGGRSAEEVRTGGLRAALAELRPQSILLLGYGSAFQRGAFRAARRCGCPLLFRGETTDHARIRSRFKAWVRDACLRWFYGHCARLLYVGQRSQAHFRRLGCPEEKLVFSPYCVDTTPFAVDEAARERWREATRRELGFRAEQTVLLFSGKLSRRKGVDLLLAAVQALPEAQRRRMAALFLGSGEMMDPLQAMAESEPAVTARFVGFQNQRQLSRFYHAADLLVLPSVESETWGLVVNDALHHGLPCVVSEAVGCAPDLVQPGLTGEICESGSAEALGRALRRAQAWARGAEVRTACRARVAGYSVQRAAEGLATACRSVWSPSRGAGGR